MHEVCPIHNDCRLKDSVEILILLDFHNHSLLAGNVFALAQALDSMDVQIVCFSQLDQLIASCDVAAVEAPIRNMPGIVFAAMQSDRESLFLQFSHCLSVF